MNFRINIVIVLLLLISCKENIKPEITTEETKQEEIITNKHDPIIVYHASFLPTKKTELISLITKKLQPEFIEYTFNKDANELKKTKEIYKSKSFLKLLAKDFKNDDFLDVASIFYSFLLPKSNIETDYISIQEWQYTDNKKAKSVFESLKNYKETEIHFKTINWIWVHQNDKIYLIFARNFMVIDVEMQTIKKELIKTVSGSGEYETIQFYE